MASPGLIVSPPAPRPPRYTLIGAAEVVGQADDHWLNGLTVWPQPCAIPRTFDPCSTGTNRAVTYATLPAGWDRPVVTVLMPVRCTAATVGLDDADFVQRIIQSFAAVESFAVEREFEQGIQFPAAPHLANGPAAPNLPAASVAQSLWEGLAQLEQDIAATGRQGFIHATPRLVTAWRKYQLVNQVANGLQTILGTPVVPGSGYQGVAPQGGTAATGTQEWAYASGPVAVRRSDIQRVPDQLRQALDRSDNSYYVFVARHYAVVADWCIHSAVKIDRAT